MTNIELAQKAKAAADFKTLYIKGCFGAPMNGTNKKRYSANLAYNAKPERKSKIQAATEDTFGFDCICFVKGLLWGWNGDTTKTYGGASYASKGVPDISESGMLEKCANVSADFSHITVGEFLWMPGHCGIYIGDGLAAEATPKWADGVQITACNCDKAGYNRRSWEKHGMLPYVSYEAAAVSNNETEDEKVNVALTKLSKGCKGEEVRSMQMLLNGRGYSVGTAGVDGSFGGATDKAVRAFQAANGLTVDGICGVNTWPKLLGIR